MYIFRLLFPGNTIRGEKMIWAKELFVNACIFVAFIFIGSQILQKTEIENKASASIQIVSGILNGILGIILMFFSVPLYPGVIMDLRHLTIIVGTICFGWGSAVITGGLLVLFRILYYGISYSSILGGGTILAITLGCILIGLLRFSTKIKWIYMCVLSGVVFTGFVSYLTEDTSRLKQIIILYWIGTIISNIIVFNLVQYLSKAHLTMKKLKEEATRDYLTGLNNVRSFDRLFNELIGRAHERKENISMLAIDIDFFKKVNDTYGHLAGDAVLQQLSGILSDAVRDFDVVARVGGEEFNVILRDCDKEHSYQIAERIRKRVEANIFRLPCGTAISITISIGVAVFPSTVTDINLIKEKTDEKLYEAKRSGRNKICI